MLTTHPDLRETNIIGRNSREYMVGADQADALRTHNIMLTGLSIAADEFCFVRLRPDFFQILVSLSGHGSVYVNETWVRCGDSAAYVCPPHELHAYHASVSGRWKFCWVQFKLETRAIQLSTIKKPMLLQADGRSLATAIEGLWRESLGLHDKSLMQRWADLVDALSQRIIEPPLLDPRLVPAWEAVDAELGRHWTVQELSHLAGVSQEHFRRLCQKSFDHSPMRHVTELRMRHAAALIASTTLTIESIANRVGYDNPFAFSTAFRRATSQSPSEYRRVRGG